MFWALIAFGVMCVACCVFAVVLGLSLLEGEVPDKLEPFTKFMVVFLFVLSAAFGTACALSGIFVGGPTTVSTIAM
jgi:hypothetical protein